MNRREVFYFQKKKSQKKTDHLSSTTNGRKLGTALFSSYLRLSATWVPCQYIALHWQWARCMAAGGLIYLHCCQSSGKHRATVQLACDELFTV
jgi:hypothetical protein